MSGFHADPAALDVLARRLEDTAEDYGTAAAAIETAGAGDLGPASVTSAFATLTTGWSGRIREAETDFGAAAANVRAAAKKYGATEAAAAEDLGRADG
ncbi:hypothetical protein [Amycolatopsis sp. cmx-4-68]|uniref:hypothetical protein n=1 Tax=Amycolatopsis sp. cmx-4-68 TaxID=2790938 RepID=UPI00397AEC11